MASGGLYSNNTTLVNILRDQPNPTHKTYIIFKIEKRKEKTNLLSIFKTFLSKMEETPKIFCK